MLGSMRFAMLAILMMAQSVCAQVIQDNGMPDQAREEILRRGNSVVHIDGVRSTGEEYGDALQPPADDSHKWFITVIVSDNCQPCLQLQADWKRSEFLLAWAKPDKPQAGWAFINFYKKGDKLQDFRWAKIQLKGTPTILVQPPRNGSWGDPSTVVCQITGYDGDPRSLAFKLAEAVKKYVTKFREKQPISSPNELLEIRAGPTAEDQAPSQVTQIKGFGAAQQPPFDVPGPSPTIDIPPMVQPTPRPTTPTPSPQTPDQPATPGPGTALYVLLSSLLAGLGGSGFTNALLIGLIGVQVWRAFRKATGQPLLVDDATFQKIVDALRGLPPTK